MCYKLRYPIITIMGHIDHGKTSLLKCLGNFSNLKEFRGITQSIKGYNINTIYGKMTFIDTPGHDFFINMREKGAKITDLIILIISSDSGVKNQTLESINYIKSFNIPCIIVISKIDKINNNIVNNIKKDLSKYNFIPEEWGGEYKYIYFSYIKNIGVNDLLKEINNKIKYINLNFNKNNLEAFILESYLDKKKGIVLYSIIKNGILRVGDYINCGNEYGKIKSIIDENKNNINITIPSIPLYIYGMSNIPLSNENINLLDNNKNIKSNLKKKKLFLINKYNNKNLLDELYNDFSKLKFKDIDNKKLNYVIKVDTYGSYKAIDNLIKNIDCNLIKINNFDIGYINYNDIILAFYSKSKLISFNLKIDNKYINLIKSKNIFFINYFTIYDIHKLIKNDIDYLLKNKDNEIYNNGVGKVCNIFSSSKSIIIIGCKIQKGKIRSNSKIKIIRDKTIIYNGYIFSLRFLKNNINEALEGTECGISIKGNINIKKDDIILSN